MIWHPKVGDRVRIRYGEKWGFMPYRDRTGTVVAVSGGRKMVNAKVRLDNWVWPHKFTVVPRGNLVRLKAERAT